MTVEAEALGAKLRLGNENSGPRVASHSIQSMSDIEAVINANTEKLSERETMIIKVIETLKDKEDIMFCLSGPFTVANMLMDSGQFYKLLRKNEKDALRLLQSIESHIVYLGRCVVKAGGAKIISYSDSVGAIEIVGPNIFENFSGPASKRVLLQLIEEDGAALVHVCAKTSIALCEVGMCEAFNASFQIRHIMMYLNYTHSKAEAGWLGIDVLRILGQILRKSLSQNLE